MDKLARYREIIKKILLADTQYPPSHGDIEATVVFDEERDSYQLMFIGWDRHRRMHSSIIHLRIRNDKIWVEWDGTQEGVAAMLLAEGIPKEDIVLAFYPPAKRKLTDFNVGNGGNKDNN